MIESNGARRRKLPDRRPGDTFKAHIGNEATPALYLRTGLYPDGTLGEIWLDQAQSGTALKGFMSALAISISVGIQYGVPLSVYVNALSGICFPPAGDVFCDAEPRVERCSSPVDYIVKQLAALFLTPPPDEKTAGSPSEPWRSGA